jgi:hypothetical protein
MTMAALAGIDQKSVSPLSCRTTAIIASRQPQPQYHMPTRKTGKDPDYQKSQTGTSLAKEGCVGHLSAGPAADSHPNIGQYQRTTDPRYPYKLGVDRIHPLTPAKCQAASGLVECYCTPPPSLSPNITYHSDRSGIAFQKEDHKGQASNLPSTGYSQCSMSFLSLALHIDHTVL